MSNEGLISREGTVLVIIDVQEKLFPLIFEKEKILNNILKLIRFAKIINMPVVLTEQYPKGLGQTIPEIKEIIPEIKPIEKVEFSCFGSEKFRLLLKDLRAKTLIISGIETHICVAQTSLEGLSSGYKICVISDATSSRKLEDKNVALERMRQSGIIVASTEMIIYELLRAAGTQEFREALKLIK
jgi:nicotinamidase-related amidase